MSGLSSGLRQHAETALSRAREHSASGCGYASHVEREFRRYLECGILARGFVRVHCAGCGRDELVAFSCKGRAVCPSCIGRRKAETATWLVAPTPSAPCSLTSTCPPSRPGPRPHALPRSSPGTTPPGPSPSIDLRATPPHSV